MTVPAGDDAPAIGDVPVQLLDPSGCRVEHERFGYSGTEADLAAALRDMVLARRIDTESSSTGCGGPSKPYDMSVGWIMISELLTSSVLDKSTLPSQVI